MYDLAVVGAGPAGSRLAAEFADRGYDVVVLERGEVGKPLACSGHVSGDVWDYLPDGAESDLKQNEIRGARFHVNDSTYEFYKDETVSYAIDRVEMDRVLAEEAEDRGADLATGTEVIGVESGSSRVELRSSDTTYTANAVAGCDGPRSTVRDEAGIDDPDELLQGILAFSDEDDSGDFVDVYLDVPDFFGWRIPRGDSVEYGAASREHVRDRFDKHVDPDAEIRDLCAGLIPIGPPEMTVSEDDRAFLVGDAAAQTKPFTGGGILYGMRAAGIAARTVEPDDTSTFGEYEDEWRDELGREIALGKLLRKGYDAPTSLQSFGLGAFEGEINVHMDRPTTLFNKRTAKRVMRNIF